MPKKSMKTFENVTTKGKNSKQTSMAIYTDTNQEFDPSAKHRPSVY